MSIQYKSRKDLKESIIEMIALVASVNYGSLTFEDINSVLIDILHENSKHDPKEPFKKQ
jgi:hypothetical protein